MPHYFWRFSHIDKKSTAKCCPSIPLSFAPFYIFPRLCRVRFVRSQSDSVHQNRPCLVLYYLVYLGQIGADLIWNKTSHHWSSLQWNDAASCRVTDRCFDDFSEQFQFPTFPFSDESTDVYFDESSDGCCSDRNSSDFYLFRTTSLWQAIDINCPEYSEQERRSFSAFFRMGKKCSFFLLLQCTSHFKVILSPSQQDSQFSAFILYAIIVTFLDWLACCNSINKMK
jgi:hypothetical protein